MGLRKTNSRTSQYYLDHSWGEYGSACHSVRGSSLPAFRVTSHACVVRLQCVHRASRHQDARLSSAMPIIVCSLLFSCVSQAIRCVVKLLVAGCFERLARFIVIKGHAVNVSVINMQFCLLGINKTKILIYATEAAFKIAGILLCLLTKFFLAASYVLQPL